jgi:hypothetical protein
VRRERGVLAASREAAVDSVLLFSGAVMRIFSLFSVGSSSAIGPSTVVRVALGGVAGFVALALVGGVLGCGGARAGEDAAGPVEVVAEAVDSDRALATHPAATAPTEDEAWTDEELEALLGQYVVDAEVPDGPPCDEERPCGAGERCDRAHHLDCDSAAVGVCRPIVEGMCTMDWRPVCGCDGQTYGNECARVGSGVARAHVGECGASLDEADGALLDE